MVSRHFRAAKTLCMRWRKYHFRQRSDFQAHTSSYSKMHHWYFVSATLALCERLPKGDADSGARDRCAGTGKSVIECQHGSVLPVTLPQKWLGTQTRRFLS
eukprot:IDg20742t1